MPFFAAFKIIPQDIVKLTRPRDDFKSGEKRRKKQKTNSQKTSLKEKLMVTLLLKFKDALRELTLQAARNCHQG
jgi:hypothetical protein